MEDQPTYTPPPITGYRSLNQAEVDLINEIKAAEIELGKLVSRVMGLPAYPTPPAVSADLPSKDARIANLAEEHLMIGFMLLVRSIAKPGTPERAAKPATLGG